MVDAVCYPGRPARTTQRRAGFAHRLMTLALLIVAHTACLACSLDEALGGGTVSFTSYPPVTSTTSAGVAASTKAPRDFPREVPVVTGLYSPEPSPFGDARAMTVTGIERSALGRAKRLLTEADYAPIQAQGMDIFLGPKYAVMVSGDDSTGSFRLHYVAFPVGAVPGMPSMPTVTIPTLLPRG
ncbi:hypothetical protein LK468_18315 [Mycobacteroides abscessus]|uniref:hypothetical protein n=1 Tax=Mycobacteroides abscessus TaxID=36809 RepID=UPI0009273567|nr:hypothetical protein [Mycobacteroides abscessus]UEA47647.1 hypothetical protein LK451_17905 [Mycobacteroides abscessus subsp. abscessus]UEA52375.1 hypothetical protein LK468_18315 [Mycobacteroides abscessus]SHY59315.1 Uncharacterised protein [Mycobacteroides abscessus subsp. bolletii]SHY69514.1 Uncharacterised protein [Mycobacteroides abscessus subsp. bolletii]SLE77738.1 Uncharacterised protein [Mycobacteroides abscessus subsp. bolletii]